MFFQIEPATFMKTGNESKLTLLVYIEHGEQDEVATSSFTIQLATGNSLSFDSRECIGRLP